MCRSSDSACCRNTSKRPGPPSRCSAPATGHASEPRLVPYLNLAYLLGVKGTYGDDQLMALALSVANWATTAINDLAHHTGRTPQQIIDQYETDIIADQEDLT